MCPARLQRPIKEILCNARMMKKKRQSDYRIERSSKNWRAAFSAKRNTNTNGPNAGFIFFLSGVG
jgi:hypothetical protein